MKVLFIGDIVARIGRATVKKVLPDLKKEKGVDFTIAQGENLTTGNGMTIEKTKEMLEIGIDFFTAGNHIWKKREFIPYLDSKKVPVIRPANYPKAPGRGYEIVKTNFGHILIVHLLGRESLNPNISNPFLVAEEILEKTKKEKLVAKIVDFHAEISSEKVAMGHFLDGKVSAVVGTHPHIPTCDARVLPKKTAVVTDIGMVGPINSVLGVKKEIIIERFLTGLPVKHENAEGDCIFNSVLIEIEKNSQAKSIERIDRIVEM